MRNNLLLLHFFSIFLNPQRVTLTYSAMTDGPIDVQLRWANLRAREHHVKGPKKSPRKMVLRRLILRKAEEAKRTTTWAPYRVQCPCLQCQNQPRWILLNFPSVDMGTLSKTVGFSLYPSHWVGRPSPVHSFSEPLEDADEIVTSVNSLFLSREDSRGVDHCHTLQHWALDNRALEPGQSFIKGREGMKKATC